MSIKTPEQIATATATPNGLVSDDGEELYDVELNGVTLYNVTGDRVDMFEGVAAAAVEADRAQLAERLREAIRFHNESVDANPEYLRGQAEMAAYLIGYSDPGEGDALREELTKEAGK